MPESYDCIHVDVLLWGLVDANTRNQALNELCPSKTDFIYRLRFHHLSLKSCDRVPIHLRIYHVAFPIVEQYSSCQKRLYSIKTNIKGLYVHVYMKDYLLPSNVLVYCTYVFFARKSHYDYVCIL